MTSASHLSSSYFSFFQSTHYKTKILLSFVLSTYKITYISSKDSGVFFVFKEHLVWPVIEAPPLGGTECRLLRDISPIFYSFEIITNEQKI